MLRLAHVLFLSAALFATPFLCADVKLPAIIGDNMPLQAGKEVPIWGWAAPGELVTVKLGEQTATATADDKGKWMLRLKALSTGGPLEMTVTGDKSKAPLTLKNIVVGEVWICSGQSNMGFLLNNAHNAKEEIANAKYPNIRLFTVKKPKFEPFHDDYAAPLADCEGKWVECSPETAGSFTAVGYFFGRHIHKVLNVPVGLIDTSWGGTPAEAWTTRATLAADADLKPIMDRFEKAKAGDTKENWDAIMAKHKKAVGAYKVSAEKMRIEAEKAKAENKEPPKTKAPQPPRPPLPAVSQSSPATLYNSMIAPLQPYAIAGAIWYQGEANAGRGFQYRKLLPAMIKDWRDAWKQGDFPFMIAQLANYHDKVPEPANSSWAELREAQTLTAINTPNTGIGLAIDIGEANDIHPKNKQDVGLRLALQALKIAYGKDIPFSGPMYDSMTVEGGKIKLKMKHVFGGLVAKDEKFGFDVPSLPGNRLEFVAELKGFALAGEDKKFYWAKAVITGGDTIEVSSDKVPKPLAVRYAWADNPDATLYNKAHLPAVPFRTDNWPLTTENAK